MVNGKTKTLQTEILSRFLSDEEYALLRGRYNQARKGWGGSKREDSLSVPVTQEEKALLKTYLEDTDISMRELAESVNLQPSQVRGQAVKTAFALLFQNHEVRKGLLG